MLRPESLELASPRPAQILSAKMFSFVIALFLLSAAWFFLLAFSGYVLYPSNLVASTGATVVGCATQPLGKNSCSPFSTDQCNIVSLFVMLYGSGGFVICLALIVMMCALYHGFLKSSIDNPRGAPKVRNSNPKEDAMTCVRLCTRCEAGNCACAVNSSRRVVSCCICPLLCSFLVGSIALFSQISFDSTTGQIEACYVLLNETDSLDSDPLGSGEADLISVPVAMKFSISTFIVHWCLFFTLALVGCGSTMYHNYKTYTNTYGNSLGIDEIRKRNSKSNIDWKMKTDSHESPHSDIAQA